MGERANCSPASSESGKAQLPIVETQNPNNFSPGKLDHPINKEYTLPPPAAIVGDVLAVSKFEETSYYAVQEEMWSRSLFN